VSYLEFKQTIRESLGKHPHGLTWKELREKAHLPYERPCPEWTRRLEQDLGLRRSKGSTNALIWTVD
jgi:hypothetical protein